MSALRQPPPSSPPATPSSPDVTAPAGDLEIEVAHEALIRHWDRLQAWLGEDRVGLQLRQELADASNRWNDRDRHADYLAHQGTRLREIEALRDANRLRLNALESSYLAACIGARDREEAEQRARLVAEERAEVQRRAANRFRLLSVGLALLVILASVASVVAYQSRQEANEQRERAEEQAVAAQVSDIAGTSINLATGDQEDQLAALLGVAAGRIADDEGVNGVDGDIGTALQASIGAPYFSWLLNSETESEVISLAFDPARNQLAAGHRNGTVMLWDLTPEPPTFRALTPTFADGDGWVSSVAFSPDGQYLAAASYPGAIQIWDLAVEDPDTAIAQRQVPRAVYSLSFGTSPTRGDFLLAAACSEPTCASNSLGDASAISDDGTVGTLSVTRWLASDGFSESGAESFELPGNRIYATDVSDDGRWLAAGGCKRFSQRPTTEPGSENACEAGFLYLRNLEESAAPLMSIDPGDGAVMSVSFAPGAADRPRLAAGGDDRIIRIWQPTAEGATLAVRLTGHNEEIRSLAFHPTDGLLVSGGHDGGVSLWDIRSPQPIIQELGDSSSWVRAVAFDAGGNRMASTHGNGQIRLWEIVPQVPLSEPGILTGHSAYIRAIAFNPNPATPPMLASAAEDGAVRIWTLENGQIAVRTIDVRPPSDLVKLSGLSFSRDGTILAVADERGAVWAFDPWQRAPTPVRIGNSRAGPLNVAFSPSHPFIAVAGSSGLVSLWDATADEPRLVGNPLDAGGTQVWAVAFNRNGTLLAAGTATGSVYRWRLSDDGQHAEVLQTLALDGVAIRAVAFGPADELVTGDSAGSLCFWGNGEPAAPTECPSRLYGHSGEVRSLVFSPAGDLLASGGIDQTVRLWNPQVLDEAPVVIPSIMEWVRSLAFSPDGGVLAAPSTQGTIRLLLPHTSDLVERACDRIGRDLTEEEWRAHMQDEPYQPTCQETESGGEQGLAQPRLASHAITAALISPLLLNRHGRRQRSLPFRRRPMRRASWRRHAIQEGSR